MNLNVKLVSFNTMTMSLLVSDNAETPYPKFFNYYRSTAYMNYSPFLTFEHKSDAEGKAVKVKAKDGMYENATFSVLDYPKIKKVFREIDAIISSEYYTMEEHIEKGFIPQLKDEYKSFRRIITNSTGKGQIAFTLCFVYRRKEDRYIPNVKLMINTDATALNIPIETFSAITMLVDELNLHSAARETIAAFISNHNLRKTNIAAAAKDVVIEEAEE